MKRYETMPEEVSFSVGKRVKDVLKQKHLTVSWLAEQVPCDRSNIYNIFRKNDISTALLRRFCEVLEYNFFKELSDWSYPDSCYEVGGGGGGCKEIGKAVSQNAYIPTC